MVAQRVPQAEAAEPTRSDRRGRLTQIGLGLGVALAILAGAFVAVRPDRGGLGTGGINANLLPKVGQTAPDFEVRDLLGNPVRLSEFRGQPVWLMFWGSWCPPCRAEFPDVQRAYEQLEPDRVRLLGVSVREPWTAAAAYAVQNEATFDVLSGDEEDGLEAYPLFNVPTHIFIDADGVIRSVVMADMSEQRALAEARALLRPVGTTG